GSMAESRIVNANITKSRGSIMQCNTLILNLCELDLHSIDQLGCTFPHITTKLIFRQCDLERCLDQLCHLLTRHWTKVVQLGVLIQHEDWWDFTMTLASVPAWQKLVNTISNHLADSLRELVVF